MNRLDIYKNLKTQVKAYTLSLPPQVLNTSCVACPAWSVQDVLAHHIHAQRCRLEEDFPPEALAAITEADESARVKAQQARDAWTERGVAERRGRTLNELLIEWDSIVDELDEAMPLTLDLTVHFDDIRETIDGPTPRNEVDTVASLRQFHAIQSAKLEARNIPQISLFSTDADELISGSELAPRVTGATYDLLRCLTSRRTRSNADQVLDWGDLSIEARAAFAVYGWPR